MKWLQSSLQFIFPCLIFSSEEGGYFDGVLICKDDEVAAFVDDFQKRAKHVRAFFIYF